MAELTPPGRIPCTHDSSVVRSSSETLQPSRLEYARVLGLLFEH
jgi:hypothetical protein